MTNRETSVLFGTLTPLVINAARIKEFSVSLKRDSKDIASWARLMLPLAGEQGPMMVRTQPERRAIRRVAYVVVLAAETLNKLRH